MEPAQLATESEARWHELSGEQVAARLANLTKFILWILPTNGGVALILLVAIVGGITLPMLPTQLFWLNLVTALFLGLMLVFEPKESDIMQRPPRDPKRPLLTFPLFMRTGLVTLISTAGAFGLFLLSARDEPPLPHRPRARRSLVLHRRYRPLHLRRR